MLNSKNKNMKSKEGESPLNELCLRRNLIFSLKNKTFFFINFQCYQYFVVFELSQVLAIFKNSLSSLCSNVPSLNDDHDLNFFFFFITKARQKTK